jgi:putative peptidoglycan lipid II flippase
VRPFSSLSEFYSAGSGLVRERVFAHYLGNSDAAGAFKAALRIPNFLQNLFGEGVLSASFIPVYSKLRSQLDEDSARKMAGVVGTILALGVSVIVLVGVVSTPYIVDLVAPGYQGDLRILTIKIVQILFPMVGLLVFSAWCLGILNSHRRFFLSYVAPVLWNAAMIATLLIYGRSRAQTDLVLLLAWGSVVGSALQLGIQLPFVFKFAGRIPFGVSKQSVKLPSVQKVFSQLGPVFISRGVVQISAYVDGMIASFLGAAAVTSLAYAQTIYLLPISLFGMAVAAAELPEMAAQAGVSEEANAKLRERIKNGLRKIAFFVVPSGMAFLILGRSVVAALYQTGKFGPEDSQYVWYILMGSVLGLLAATWGRLYSSAFYAIGDTRTPLKFAVVRVTLTILLGLLGAFTLRPWIVQFFATLPGLGLPHLPMIELSLGAVGLTASAGLAGTIEFLLLRHQMQKRIGSTILPLHFKMKVWGSAFTAAILAFAFEKFVLLPAQLPIMIGRYDLEPVLVLALFGCLYGLFAIVTGIDEASHFVKKLRRR